MSQFCFFDPIGHWFYCNHFNAFSACLDTSEQGDLEKCDLLREYSKSYEYKPISNEDLLNYSFNIYNDGNLLEIVSCSCK